MMYKSDYFCRLSPINQAHLLQRKAEKCIKKEKFEDAIAYHQDAARLLQNVLSRAKVIELPTNILTSLQAQIDHHKKQDKLIMLRKEQQENLREYQKQQKLSLGISQEPFQDLYNCSTTSIDSYDSSVSATSLHQNSVLHDHLNKREEVIKTLGTLVRQQQHQILILSSKLKEKDDENKRLCQKLEEMQQTIHQEVPSIP